jgi:putative ABC transport system permease protein
MNKGQMKTPPKIARWILSVTNRKYNRESVLGDFDEFYSDVFEARGKKEADKWYRGQALKSIPKFISANIYRGAVMFKKNLITIFRNIKKQKLNSSLNVVGLAIAIASFLIIFTHVQNELSFEQCFPKADRICRVDIDSKYGNTIRQWTNVPVPLGEMLKGEYSEIEDFTRITDRIGSTILEYTTPSGKKKTFEEQNGVYADASIIKTFNLSLISGDPNTALNDIGSIVLTKSMSDKYFGDEDPVGKTLIDLNSQKQLTVTGLIHNMPEATHLQFDFLISINTWFMMLEDYGYESAMQSRSWKALKTYLLFKPGTSYQNVAKELPVFQKKFYADDPDREETFLLRPIKDIHLYSHRENELTVNSDISYVYIFLIIGLFILLIAVVNFINIFLAQSLKRFKEVGVRKVMGAHRRQIFTQFVQESFLLTLLATVLSVAFVGIFLPVYNNMAERNVALSNLFSLDNLLVLMGIIVFISFAAGFYPSLFISKLPPSSTFFEYRNPRSYISIFRKGLVIFQFTISVFMIVATIIVYRQLQFINHAELGFNKSGLVALKLPGDLVQRKTKVSIALRDQLDNYSGIKNATFVSNMPGENLSIEHLIPEGRDRNELPTVRVVRVDENYISTMGIELKEGRNFSRYSGEDLRYILNEAAVKALSLKEPVGTKCEGYFGKGEIVGVIKNYNFESLHSSIEPLVLEYSPKVRHYLIFSCMGKNVVDVMNYVEKTYKETVPGSLFNYTFISDELSRLYVLEIKLNNVFLAFALLSIFISCLGLFGLSVYSAELRVKEIGVRKVLGASASGIINIVSKEFIQWIIIANLLAFPAAYYFMNKWLSNFAYRVEIDYLTFIFGGLLSTAIAILTITYQSLKSAFLNPIDAIKYE